MGQGFHAAIIRCLVGGHPDTVPQPQSELLTPAEKMFKDGQKKIRVTLKEDWVFQERSINIDESPNQSTVDVILFGTGK
jgi:hypothetical protein